MVYSCAETKVRSVFAAPERAGMIGGGRSPTPIMTARSRGQQTQTWLRSRHRNIILFLQTVVVVIVVGISIPARSEREGKPIPSRSEREGMEKTVFSRRLERYRNRSMNSLRYSADHL